MLVKLLDDKDAEVRAQAAKGLGDLKYAKAQDALVKRLADSEPRVQFFAAQSLGKLGNEASAEPLLALLRANDNKDAYLRLAASYALSKLRRGRRAGERPRRIRPPPCGSACCWRIATCIDPAIATFLNDADAFIVREAAEAINDAPIEPALAPLAGKLASAPVADEALVVRALNANYRLGDAPRAQAIAQLRAQRQGHARDARRGAAPARAVGQGAAARPRGRHLPAHESPRRPTDAVAALAPEVAQAAGGTASRAGAARRHRSGRSRWR